MGCQGVVIVQGGYVAVLVKAAYPVAAHFSISAKTVQNCHYQIKGKLGVKSDIELTRLALRMGLI